MKETHMSIYEARYSGSMKTSFDADNDDQAIQRMCDVLRIPQPLTCEVLDERGILALVRLPENPDKQETQVFPPMETADEIAERERFATGHA